MAISPKLLNEGEHIVLSTRTHVKVLILPAVVLIVLAGLAGYLSSLPSGDQAMLSGPSGKPVIRALSPLAIQRT